MITFDLNWWAVLVVIVGSMVLGFLWFSKALFGKPWMVAIGKTADDLKKGQAKSMPPMVILSIIQAFVLAHVIIWSGAATFGDGFLVGVLTWLGFGFASGAMNGFFAQRNMKVVLIEQLYFGVLLSFGGAVLALWQ